jgi:GMP synthase (glutamine-hydrolysing)
MILLYVVNNYGQFNHLITRALRDLDIEATLISNTTPASQVQSKCNGIILGGGPDLNRAGNCAEYLDLGLPVLGICLGLHIIASHFGTPVKSGEMGGYGAVPILRDVHEPCPEDALLKGYPDEFSVWASHADEITALPKGFTRLATSTICQYEAIGNASKNIYGVQWHPEVSHTEHGSLLFENFYTIVRESQ